MREVGYTDDLALFTNLSAQAESLLHTLDQSDIGLDVNTDKTGFMCFKKGDISTLRGKPQN